MENPNQHHEITISIKEVKKISYIFSFIVVSIVTLAYLFTWGPIYSITITLMQIILFFLFYFLTIIAHELLHGIGFRYAGGGNWKDIKFGVIWKSFVFYAHCKIPLKKAPYLFALYLPNILLGVVPLIIGFIVNNMFLILLSTLMVLGGIGDVTMAWKLRSVPKDALIRDFPDKIGCEVFLETSPSHQPQDQKKSQDL